MIKFNGPNSRSFPQYNPRDQLSINKHFSRWFESHHSWYANKFRYFIPVFLKSEIKSEQKDGFNVMTDEQNRLLQRLIDNNREAFVKAKKGEPYIVGTCTSNRLMRMKKVVEFLLALDPNRVDVLEKC